MKKTCGCGRSYDARQWAALRLVGYQGRIAGLWARRLELRLCECGLCIAVEVA